MAILRQVLNFESVLAVLFLFQHGARSLLSFWHHSVDKNISSCVMGCLGGFYFVCVRYGLLWLFFFFFFPARTQSYWVLLCFKGHLEKKHEMEIENNTQEI